MDRSAYDVYFDLEERHFWRVARRRFLLSVLEEHLPSRRPLRLLDVGGACTLVSRDMARFGEVTVIEPDAPTAALAKEKLGLDVRVGSLPDELPVEGEFDAITLFDVLEHLDDEGPALDALRARLKPDGLLVVTVPAVPWLWSSHDVAVHHRRRYLKDGLSGVLERGGFRVRRATYFTSLLFPVVAAQRVADRLKGIPEKPTYSVKVPPGPLNAAFGAVMNLERGLLKSVDLPIGSSILAVCDQAAAGARRSSHSHAGAANTAP